jgi:hypothetical protein
MSRCFDWINNLIAIFEEKGAMGRHDDTGNLLDPDPKLVKIEGASENDLELINTVEIALSQMRTRLTTWNIRDTETKLVGIIRKISSINAAISLLDKARAKLEQLSSWKEENWMSDPRVAFYQIGIRLVARNPDFLDDFRTYIEFLWSENKSVKMPLSKNTQLWSTFEYHVLLRDAEKGKGGAVLPRQSLEFLPFRKPFIPYISASDIGKVHELVRDLWGAQSEQDRRDSSMYAPSFMYESEATRGESFFVVPRTPAEVTKEDVLIEGVYGHADWVIKWQSSCKQPKNKIFPDILRDYWFARIASGLGVSQQVYYLSPPAKFPKYIPPKLIFGMTGESWTKCARDFKSSVRFMIMERIQFTVADMVEQEPSVVEAQIPFFGSLGSNNGLRFQTALVMAISIVKKLKTLHTSENPIVHGDVHVGNIAVKNFDTHLREANFVLIDFGKSFFNAEFEGQEPRGSWSGPPCIGSSFNFDGFRSSFRDDVYRTLLAAAFLMNERDSLWEHCVSMSDNGEIDQLVNFHAEEFIFDAPRGRANIVQKAFPSMEETHRDQIRSHLAEALRLARAVPSVEENPDYDGITRVLQSALDLTTPGSVQKHQTFV